LFPLFNNINTRIKKPTCKEKGTNKITVGGDSVSTVEILYGNNAVRTLDLEGLKRKMTWQTSIQYSNEPTNQMQQLITGLLLVV
jgi:hypothetical protein